MPKLMAATLSLKRMFEALRVPILLPASSFCVTVLDAAQPERQRGADVGEDIDGSSRIKRQFELRIVAERGFHVVAGGVGLVGEFRRSGRQREFELGEQSETALRVESRVGAVENE